jgi:hypothetical protein
MGRERQPLPVWGKQWVLELAELTWSSVAAEKMYCSGLKKKKRKREEGRGRKEERRKGKGEEEITTIRG